MLYSGIEISRFCNSSEKDRNLFVVVARVCPEKSPEFILDVAEKLYQKNSKLRFLWCGGGDGLSQLEEEASRRMIPIMFRGSTGCRELFEECFIHAYAFEKRRIWDGCSRSTVVWSAGFCV